MKKLFVALLMGMMLCPMSMEAKIYKAKGCVLEPVFFPKSPNQDYINLYVNETTGDMVIWPNYNISGLQITIVGNGVTYFNTTVSLSVGQSYNDCLSYLNVGTYMLTFSTIDGIIAMYEITVEDD